MPSTADSPVLTRDMLAGKHPPAAPFIPGNWRAHVGGTGDAPEFAVFLNDRQFIRIPDIGPAAQQSATANLFAASAEIHGALVDAVAWAESEEKDWSPAFRESVNLWRKALSRVMP